MSQDDFVVRAVKEGWVLASAAFAALWVRSRASAAHVTGLAQLAESCVVAGVVDANIYSRADGYVDCQSSVVVQSSPGDVFSRPHSQELSHQ